MKITSLRPLPDELQGVHRFALVAAADGMEWEAEALDMSRPTSDGRMIVQDGLSIRTPPLALLYCPELEGGHDGAVQVGTIQQASIDGTLVRMAGTWLDSPDPEVAAIIADVQQRTGTDAGLSVSVDLAVQKAVVTLVIPGEEEQEIEQAITEGEDVTVEIPLIDTETEVLRIDQCEVIGLTIVTQPAQDGLSIVNLSWEPIEETPEDQPVAAATLKNTAAIGHVDLPVSIGGKDVGTYRVNLVGDLGPGTVLSPTAYVRTRKPDAVTAAAVAVTAQDGFIPPRAWFEMAEPDEPTALTITPDGQVYGHIAAWGSCHTGVLGECLEPPQNPSGEYPWFNLGLRTTDDGEVTVGQLTMDADHARLTLGIKDAHDCYANSALAVADVHVTEGEYGPWACGAIRPGVSDEQVEAARALKISGDWRPTDEGLELIAGLLVPFPGYVVPRAALVASASGTPQVAALVGAGVVQDPLPEGSPQRSPAPSGTNTRLRVMAAQARGGLKAAAELAR